MLNSIFVSIASYRDTVCSETLKNMYEMADIPERIFTGICEQNVFSEENEKCMTPSFRYENNIRIIRVPYYQAKGPTYARYLCSTLYRGEKYYLQIDSHIKFVKGWDTKCINMIKILKNTGLSDKPVLSYYSRSIDDYNKNIDNKEVPTICRSFFNDRGMISFEGANIVKSNGVPRESAFLAAGFFFCESKFLDELPFDPELKNIFVGEEILHSIRFYTHGWDIFTPSEDIVFHEYTRKDKPKVWTDNKFDDTEAFEKIKYLLNLGGSVSGELSDNLKYYGLGKERTLEDYYKFAGINIQQKSKSRDFCSNSVENFKSTMKRCPYKYYILGILMVSIITLTCYRPMKQ